jgi:selenocysteine lyase/cysteine desulfurase
VERLDRALRPLVQTLRDGLVDQELGLLTPAAPEFASGIVSFACAEPEQKAAWLAHQDIIVWGGDGRIRVSLHVYNDMEDVRRCLDAIRRVPGHLQMRMASSNQ